MEDAYDYRDHLEKGLEMDIEAHLYHYDDAVCESARRLKRVFDLYGNLRAKPYKEESAALSNLVRDLKSETYAADVAALTKTEWVEKVGEANDSFITKFDNRTNELSARALGAAREARTVTDPAYKAFIGKVNAAAVFKGEADYSAFIDKVNYLIDYARNTIAARKGRAKKVEMTSEAKV